MHGTPKHDHAAGITGGLLARIFEYPGDRDEAGAAVPGALPPRQGNDDPGLQRLLDPVDTAEQIALIASLDFPEHAEGFVTFCEAIGTMTPAERDELYIKTFDFRPDTALEFGWHLFGETYKRGAFLVRIREALREHGIDEGANLPDHVTCLLRLLDRLPQEDGESLIVEVILPGMSKVREALDNDPENPWRNLVRSVTAILTDQVHEELDAVMAIQQQTIAEADADARRAAEVEAAHDSQFESRGGGHV